MSADGRRWPLSSLAAVCCLLAGCGTRIVVDTPMGVATPLGASSSGPPPGPQAPGPIEIRNGTYAGTAAPLDTGGGLCIDNLQVSGFRVRGNFVRLGGYHGKIDAEGGLQMVYGGNWIIGQFEEGTFRGQLTLYDRLGAPGCTFMLNLQRVGS